MEYRHELKFMVSDLTIEKLRHRLEPVMEKDEFHDDFYTIRSLYFDDLFDSCLNENLAGTDDRFKYRIRFYDDNKDYINLEKKYKRRGMTKKESQHLSLDQVSAFMEGLEGLGECDSLSDDLSTELMAAGLKSGMMPKCIVEYDRLAFVEPTGNVRITFDMNLRGSKDVERFLDTDDEFALPVIEPGMHILEVKYDEFLPKYILQLVDLNNLHRQSFSKYAMVREVLG